MSHGLESVGQLRPKLEARPTRDYVNAGVKTEPASTHFDSTWSEF